MLTIYGRRNSSNVQLIMWAVAELGIEHKRVDYGHGYASPRTAEFLRMNPMGKVPVIQDDNVIIFESAAILRYLAATYGDETFWPSSPTARAPLDAWAEWGKNTFTEAVLEIFVYDVRTLPEKRNPAALDRASKLTTSLAKILDMRLEALQWVCGEDFTFADIVCGHIMHRYFTLEWDRPDLPNIANYYKKLQERAAYRDNAMVSYESLRGSY